MKSIKRGLIGLFGLVLLIGLVGLGTLTGAKLTLTNQTKLENYASQTAVYSEFIDNTVSQTNKAFAGGQASNFDTQIKRAAVSAVSKSQFDGYLNQIIAANLSWLKGKTKSPQFNINLATNKTSFADSITNYTENLIASLHVCTTTEALTINPDSPLTLTCRPSFISPTTLADTVKGYIDNSNSILANSTITPTSLSKELTNSSTPYYQKATKAPDLYRVLDQAPFVALAVVLVSLIILKFLIRSKKRYLRLAAVIFVLSGLISSATKLFTGNINSHVNSQLTQHLDLQVFKPSFLHFASSVSTGISNDVFKFGILYLLIGILMLVPVYMRGSRRKLVHVEPKPKVTDRPKPVAKKIDLIKTPPKRVDKLDISSTRNRFRTGASDSSGNKSKKSKLIQ